MGESFSVGEPAQVRPDIPDVAPDMRCYLGRQVVVDSELRWVFGHSRPMHVVYCPMDATRFYVAANCLRKLPPPQDWKKLCNLSDAPCDLVSA